MALSDAQLAQRRAAGRKGGAVRAAQFTSESQAAAREKLGRDKLAAGGRACQAVQRERYGCHYASRRAARWRARHRTALEHIVEEWLDAEWVDHDVEREIVPGKVYADLVVYAPGGRKIAVEADGARFHLNNDYVGQDREARDRERDDLIRAAGYEVLHLAEADIRSGAARETLLKFLQRAEPG